MLPTEQLNVVESTESNDTGKKGTDYSLHLTESQQIRTFRVQLY